MGVRTFTRTAMLAGAASLCAGLAAAQQAPGDAGAVVVQESPMAAIVEEDRLDIDGPLADGAGRQTESDLDPAPAESGDGAALDPDAETPAPAAPDDADAPAPLARAETEGPEAAIVQQEVAEGEAAEQAEDPAE